MTNEEYLIAALNDEIDDGGAARESIVNYHIGCPYFGRDKRGLCNNGQPLSRELCVECKEKWLESEVDQ